MPLALPWKRGEVRGRTLPTSVIKVVSKVLHYSSLVLTDHRAATSYLGNLGYPQSGPIVINMKTRQKTRHISSAFTIVKPRTGRQSALARRAYGCLLFGEKASIDTLLSWCQGQNLSLGGDKHAIVG